MPYHFLALGALDLTSLPFAFLIRDEMLNMLGLSVSSVYWYGCEGIDRIESKLTYEDTKEAC